MLRCLLVRLGKAEREGGRLLDKRLRRFSCTLKLGDPLFLLPPGHLRIECAPSRPYLLALPSQCSLNRSWNQDRYFPHGFSFWHLHCNSLLEWDLLQCGEGSVAQFHTHWLDLLVFCPQKKLPVYTNNLNNEVE